MELSLRLLHVPVDGSPMIREPGQSGPNPAAARILIVDDEPAAAEAVRDHLLACGYTVDMAFNADDALRAVQQVHRDVVLLDNWPGVDGVEGIRRIRAVDSTLPVILAVESADVRLMRETLKFAACGHVVKPIDFAVLDRAIGVLTSRDAQAVEQNNLVEGGHNENQTRVAVVRRSWRRSALRDGGQRSIEPARGLLGAEARRAARRGSAGT